MLKKHIVHDFIGVWLLLTGCLIAGLVVNEMRSTPLSLVYSTPASRLNQTVEQLGPSATTSVALDGDVNRDEMQKISVDHEALILDARPEIFYRLGHIPSALSLPRDDFEKQYQVLQSTLQSHRDKPLVVYCSSTDCHDSQMVADALQKLGYSHVGSSGEDGAIGRAPACRRKRNEDKIRNSIPAMELLAGSPYLGAVFIYAAILKIGSPQDFADSIAAYQILPFSIINLLALGLPLFELVCGLSVLTGFFLRIGVLGIFAMLAFFVGALAIDLLRGLSIDCGCFGAHSWLDSNPWVALSRDGILLGTAMFVYVYSASSFGSSAINRLKRSSAGL